MADDKFKMPQSSYEELAKVIKAYGHIEDPAGLDEVSKLVGLHTTIISRNAGFLISSGILEPGQRKIATPVGRSLAHALEHEMPDEIRLWWREVVHQTEFLSKVLTAIKIRNGMDASTLEAHIAYSAGQPKKPQFMTGARTVIDILRAAEVIKESDGKIVAFELIEAPSETSQSSAHFATPRAITNLVTFGAEDLAHRGSIGSGYELRINVNVTCTPDDLVGLSDKLKQFIRDLNKESQDAIAEIETEQ